MKLGFIVYHTDYRRQKAASSKASTTGKWLQVLLLSALLFQVPTLAYGQSGKDSAKPMITRWGKQVRPENAWREYPRPQLVRREWLNLNGLWEYAILRDTDPQPSAYAGKILVPYPVESTLSGVAKTFTERDRLWYRRSFSIPAKWNGKRFLLHFGAVDYEATIWVNGALVGSHSGGFDAFSFDITNYLKSSGNQELVVSVKDPTNTDDMPRGKQKLSAGGIWYTPVSGIWQTVWVEPVAKELSIAELRITPNIDDKTISVSVLGGSPLSTDQYFVRIRAFDGSKKLSESVHRVDRVQRLKIDRPKLWSPETPFLYRLSAELFRGEDPLVPPVVDSTLWHFKRYGATEAQLYSTLPANAVLLDSVGSYFAMRKISVAKNPDGFPALMLNNQPYFQYGTLDQGYWPDGLLTPPSDAAMKFDMEVLKKSGFNMLRKHIKVEPARYYHHADSMGLLIWQDMPSAIAATTLRPKNRVSISEHVRKDDEGEAIKRTGSMQQYELELRRMIDGLYHFPSIVTWVVHNEGWGQYDTQRLAENVKAYDSSRLVNAASGWRDVMNAGDMVDKHTYGELLWNIKNGMDEMLPDPQRRRVAVLGEFGGVKLGVKGHLWDEAKVFKNYSAASALDDLIEKYRNRLQQVIDARKTLHLNAAVYTQTTDVESEINGLITYDREVIKINPEVLSKMHEPLYK
jgi:beta-galactosidase/beta-glucuronidase